MARVSEPNPWAFCPHELAAQEEEHVCAFCEACEVAEEGDYCSDECQALAEQEHVDDRRTTNQLDERI